MAKGLKTGGREAGTPNKDTKEIADLLREKFPDYHPIISMAEIANDESNDIAIRLQANKEVAKYICPQLKAVEIKQETLNKPLIIDWGDYPTDELKKIIEKFDKEY